MTENATESLSASFLECTSGRIFCIQSFPLHCLGHSVLLVPAFAEEMNSSRRFFALMRRQLCESGFTVIQPDLYGTGDSEGTFDKALWHNWTADLSQLVQSHFRDSSHKLSVLSLRCGCLLTQSLIFSFDELPSPITLENLIYIQPEISGYDVITRLLRQRVARSRLSGKSSETTQLLWQKLEQGKNVQSAGYEIGSELAMQMRECRLNTKKSQAAATNQVWIEMTPDSNTDAITDQWTLHRISSQPFWQMHDIEPVYEVVSAITELFNV